jgi:hypothetical protein
MATSAKRQTANRIPACGCWSCDLCAAELDLDMCLAPPARPAAARAPESAAEHAETLLAVFGGELAVY